MSRQRDRAVQRSSRPVAWRAGRTSASPAPVLAPVLVGLGLQAVAVVAGVLLGMSAAPIVLGVLAIGLIVAVIAHRTVGSLVAGAGMRLVQPYAPGEQVRLFVPSHDAVEDAEVVRVGPANTALMTRDGLVLVPNSRMLRGSSDAPAA